MVYRLGIVWLGLEENKIYLTTLPGTSRTLELNTSMAVLDVRPEV